MSNKIAVIASGSLNTRSATACPSGVLLLIVLTGFALASLPERMHGQQPARQEVTVLELAPDDPAKASPEKLSQARDVLQRRLDYLWPPHRHSKPYATVVVTNNLLRVELGPGCDSQGAKLLAATKGTLVFTGSDQAMEVGTLPENPGQTIFTSVDVASSMGKRKPDDQTSWNLNLAFRPEAAQRLAQYTSAHVGSFINLLLDGKVVFSAKIASPISDGVAVISGNEEVAGLVPLLSSGPLPFKLLPMTEAIAEETVPHASLLDQQSNGVESYDALRVFVHSIPYDVLGILLSVGLLISLIGARRAISAKRVPAHLAVTLGIFFVYMLLRQIIPR